MKILFRITDILLVAVLVAGGLHLVVENTGLLNAGNTSQQTEMQAAGSESLAQPPARPEGGPGEGSGSMLRGWSDLLGSLAKISVITVVILALQSLVTRLRRRPMKLVFA